MNKFASLRNVYLGTLCIRKHDHSGRGESYRHINNGTCAECQRERILRWHKSIAGKQSRSVTRKVRKDKITAYNKEYRQQHKEKIATYNEQYCAENRDWFLSYYRTYNATKKAKKRHATPVWANLAEIELVYKKAHELTVSTGVPHEVDHIVPLTSDRVCGLHVPANLRVITATANRSKKNYWWPDGGLNGYEDRLAYWEIAKEVLA